MVRSPIILPKKDLTVIERKTGTAQFFLYS